MALCARAIFIIGYDQTYIKIRHFQITHSISNEFDLFCVGADRVWCVAIDVTTEMRTHSE